MCVFREGHHLPYIIWIIHFFAWSIFLFSNKKNQNCLKYLLNSICFFPFDIFSRVFFFLLNILHYQRQIIYNFYFFSPFFLIIEFDRVIYSNAADSLGPLDAKIQWSKNNSVGRCFKVFEMMLIFIFMSIRLIIRYAKWSDNWNRDVSSIDFDERNAFLERNRKCEWLFERERSASV